LIAITPGTSHGTRLNGRSAHRHPEHEQRRRRRGVLQELDHPVERDRQLDMQRRHQRAQHR
jgi:hypothetical protein